MLRRAFGDPSVIESRDGGYALAVEPSDVDAIAVLGAVAAASGLLDAGDDAGAADLCASTLKLYRGEVLQAAGDGEWVDPHRARLDEARMKLLEIQFTARLRLGDVADVIGELEAAVATYPFQESLWELLITAMYRAGRQADALATYQRVRRQLAEELGLDPRPQLQELEQRILAQDASLDLASPPAGRDGPSRPAGNLPSMTAELVGRESEVAAVSDLLAGERLVEIVGPGGIGKTAVAIAVGRGLASSTDGVWLARLETATTTNDVVDVLVSAVDGPGGEAALFERLKGSSAVVILDNCEHVIDAAAALAVRLLDAAPALRILCTSQVAPRHRRRGRLRAGAPGTRRRRRAVHPPCHGTTPEQQRECGPGRRARPVPLSRRSATGDRAGRGADQDAVGRGDHPPPRRPVPRPERPDQPAAGTPPVTQVDHPMELRPAVPRRPAGTVGAGHLCRRRTPARRGVRPRSPGRAGSRGDRRGRPAGEPVAGDRRRRGALAVGALPAPRQHPGVRARSHDRRGAGRSRAGSPRRMVREPGRDLHSGRAQQSPSRAPGLRPDRARQRRRSAGLGCHPRSAARARHGQRLRVGLGRPRRQPRRPTDPDRTRVGRQRGAGPRPGQCAPARGVDRSVHGSPRNRSHPHRRGAEPGRRDS